MVFFAVSTMVMTSQYILQYIVKHVQCRNGYQQNQEEEADHLKIILIRFKKNPEGEEENREATTSPRKKKLFLCQNAGEDVQEKLNRIQ